MIGPMINEEKIARTEVIEVKNTFNDYTSVFGAIRVKV